MFKLPFGCFPTTSIMTTISYPSSKYGPRFPFPVVENERITLSDHDHHALLVKQQWRNFDGSLYKTKQTPRPLTTQTMTQQYFLIQSIIHARIMNLGPSCSNKKIGPDFLEDYTDSGYFLSQWGETSFLRSNVSKLPISVVFEAVSSKKAHN